MISLSQSVSTYTATSMSASVALAFASASLLQSVLFSTFAWLLKGASIIAFSCTLYSVSQTLLTCCWTSVIVRASSQLAFLLACYSVYAPASWPLGRLLCRLVSRTAALLVFQPVCLLVRRPTFWLFLRQVSRPLRLLACHPVCLQKHHFRRWLVSPSFSHFTSACLAIIW